MMHTLSSNRRKLISTPFSVTVKTISDYAFFTLTLKLLCF